VASDEWRVARKGGKKIENRNSKIRKKKVWCERRATKKARENRKIEGKKDLTTEFSERRARRHREEE
jgi:hypothetical protein